MEASVFTMAWDQARTAIDWMPDWVLAAAVLTTAVGVAVLLHCALFIAWRRLVGVRHPALAKIGLQTRGPIRLALILLALAIAIPFAPIEYRVATVVARLFQLGVIVLLGWVALIAINIASEMYLRRFRLDVEDNLLARKQVTQIRVLRGAAATLITLVTLAAALMTFESVRQYGVSLFASAGIAGIVVGLAARPVLSNLIAGVQLAITQPVRLEDAVVVENEWGWIEEITATYVVVRLWDWRRLIVPLSYFMEKPFQNWTRETAALIGTVMLYVDYRVPVDRVRQKLNEVVRKSSLWDGRVVALQVTEARERSVELRALVSARNAAHTFDLRCEVREKLVAFLQQEFPFALPRERAEIEFATALPGDNGSGRPARLS